MKKFFVGGVLSLTVVALCFAFWSPLTKTIAEIDLPFGDDEPDIPSMLKNAKNSVTKEEFLTQRAEYFGLLRGISKNKEVDPKLRQNAIEKMEQHQQDFARNPNGDNALLAAWNPIGPAPIISGNSRYSGRTISIAVHPTNPNIVYVGAAQGGLYRSTDGGINWVSLMDSAESSAIGAIAISPSQPETVYIGTGEHNFSADSFFGVGIYRINNASTTANLTGPLNKDAGNNDIFSGRGISKIIVHPSDPNTIFVASTSGVGGIGGGASNTLPSRGIYRSTNATSTNPTFNKLTGLAGNINASVRDIAIDPNDPNIVVAGLVTSGGIGGLYLSTNALSANPTFTQTEIFNSTSTSELTAEFAAIRPFGANNATFYAAVGNGGGRVLRSTDGGATWTQQIDNNFCTPQCFYDIAIAVDPTNADRVYLGGSPALVAGVSTNGGTSFTSTGAGVHVDTHALAVAPSNTSVVYLGTDGGIYKSTDSGNSWQDLNNNQFFATQFMSIAVHPTDADFTIGGTQDNGTLFYNSSGGDWNRVDGGDGGYAQIDQNASDTTNVRMYHTYFNRTNSVVGYATRPNVNSGWSFRGCNGTTPANGINCNDTAILFYAPLERGPGNPNTIYYGSDRLYRTDDEGLNHTVVSQAPISSGNAISAIGISQQNDNVRIVGLRNGELWGTSTGSSTLENLDPTGVIPDRFVARAIVDPNSPNTAYITLSDFGVNNVYKTTNLNASPPNWTNASGTGGTGIPQVPVSAFVVDPLNSNNLYAGTDIGVYASTDGGNSWVPFGTGLPRVAVFGMAITNVAPRKLRIATHGKGMYEIALSSSPLSKAPFDYDGDSKTDISIFRPGLGQWWIQKSSNLVVTANSFGVSTDTLVPADFTGDGKVDIAFFRPSTGEWFVLRSEDNSFFAFPFGANGDIPTPGDFDGDGTSDAAVFRPSNSTWFINNSGGGQTIQAFGSSGDLPIAQDFDGDGKTDLAVYRPSLSQWFFQRSSNQSVRGFQFGVSGDKAVPLDYTGDGKADIAFFRPNTGTWFVLRSEDDSFFSFPFGTTTDIPVPGDYDGDGKADAAVFRPGNATWFINGTQAGFIIQEFGIVGDNPTPNSYVR